MSAEVIDARSLVPFNYDSVIASVHKTGRIVITGDACERNSFMRNLASNITELAFDDLDAPPVVVGSKNWITPAHELEKAFSHSPNGSWMPSINGSCRCRDMSAPIITRSWSRSGKTVWGSDCHGRGSHGNLIENMEGSVAMELYLNEERVDVVKKYLDLYPIDGITTNPKMMGESGQNSL